ncbi:MAG: rod shape-determining protein MreC [Bdellovibrionales bacterium]
MQGRSRSSGWVSSTAMSWRVLVLRFSFAFLISLSVALLIVSHNQAAWVQNARARAVDLMSPVFSALSEPVALIDSFTGRIASYRALLKENEKLRTQNATLTKWQTMALTLKDENKELRGLLNYKSEPSLAYISARVIANTGGAFVRSLIVTAGEVDGVRQGMAAVTGNGLVGRVVELGEWSSRLLLITDLTSRIPVKILGTGEHAVLAGDNTAVPKMLYLPEEFEARVGSRVVTSGHGGIFPPDIPVGIISAIKPHSIEVTPMTALGEINQIRLIDFGLTGGSVNQIAKKIKASSSQ